MYRGAGPPIEAISSAVRHFAFELLLAASRAKSAAQPARLPSADDSCRRVAEALFFVTHHPSPTPSSVIQLQSAHEARKEHAPTQRPRGSAWSSEEEEACSHSHTPPHWREPSVPEHAGAKDIRAPLFDCPSNTRTCLRTLIACTQRCVHAIARLANRSSVRVLTILSTRTGNVMCECDPTHCEFGARAHVLSACHPTHGFGARAPSVLCVGRPASVLRSRWAYPP